MRIQFGTILAAGLALAAHGGYEISFDSPVSGSEREYKGEGFSLKDWWMGPEVKGESAWATESLPIGNGWFGASIFGWISDERVQITHKALYLDPIWPDASQRGVATLTNTEELKTLPKLTDALELRLSFPHVHGEVKDYRRALSIDDAIATVEYTAGDVRFRREYFASYPDRVLVAHLSADRAGALSFAVRAENPYLMEQRTGSVAVKDGGISADQHFAAFNLDFSARICVSTDGTLASEGASLRVNGATEATVVLSCDTNWRFDPEIMLKGVCKKDPQLRKRVDGVVDAAISKGYALLKKRHLEDYHSLYRRVEFALDDAGREFSGVERLFQYGRYLLITSSRSGTMPNNLQGTWNALPQAPWAGGLWMNINEQMNYWPAFSCNLAECFEPLVKFLEMARPASHKAALDYLRRYPTSRNLPPVEEGMWCIGTGMIPFRTAIPGGHSGPGTGGFTTKLLWDWWDFTRDRAALESAYPLLRGVADFDCRAVVLTNGVYLSAYSASPEQRKGTELGEAASGADGIYSTVGCAFDQQMILENDRDFLRAHKLLGKSEDILTAAVREHIGKLDPFQVGADGQLKEFREENRYGEIGEKDHRHISHLCALAPGETLNVFDAPEYAAAAKRTLDLRGLSGGWAAAHRIICYARLREGESAGRHLAAFLKTELGPNLWHIHRLSNVPVFQIDANFGVTAAVAEMLAQGDGNGRVDLLPAIPDAWRKGGEFKGLCVRGGYIVSCRWKDGKVVSFSAVPAQGEKPAKVYAFGKELSATEDFARWVDPFIGTMGDGNCFPGPCRPFGLVQPSPDTGKKVTCGGYKFTDSTVCGFSQTHLNGTGRPAMGDISILPFFSTGLTGLSGDAPSDSRNPVNLVNPVKKETEVAEVGYYAVTLENGVRCEATATERVAVWRFTWPDDAARKLYIDAASMLMQSWNAKLGATVPESSYAIGEDGKTIRGYKKALGWTPYKLFYTIEFSEPWAKIKKLPSDPFKGKGDRWMIDFDTLTGLTGLTRLSGGVPPAPHNPVNLVNPVKKTSSIEVRIALSTVSEDGAAANMKAEAEGKSFDHIRKECRDSWNELLSRAQLVKGTDEQKKNWYTALYHLFIQPNVQSDVDGRYRGADDVIRTAKRGHYSTFSLWDTFRAAHPLYTILVPERVPGFVDSLLAFGREHGHLPMWTMWNGEDHCMVGIHSIPVIVDAWKKGLLTGLTGLTGLSGGVPPDPRNPVNLVNPVQNKLLTIMVQSMINNDGENPKNCWNAYWENGYIPYFAGEFDEHLPKGQSVSITLELAYNWWCIADYARMIGDMKTAKEAQKWADCWRNVFDRETGFVRPRAPKTSGGGWREPFDPSNPRVGGNFWSDFTEANSWIYTWHVFQDVDALADAFSGREKALAKLDEFFATIPKGKKGNSDEGGLTADGNLRRGQIGQYWHGNEPSHHIAYLYSLWGRRDKTASLVGRICREAYQPKPQGLCGNDDCGQMSAWYLFSMMGFYPVNPCGDGYVLGAVQAEEVKLRVGSGEFRVVRCGDGGGVMLNGEVVKGVKISHEDIMRGGTLSF